MQKVKEQLDGLPAVFGVIEGEWVAKVSSCIRLRIEVVTLAKNLTTAQLYAVFALKCYLEFILNLLV